MSQTTAGQMNLGGSMQCVRMDDMDDINAVKIMSISSESQNQGP